MIEHAPSETAQGRRHFAGFFVGMMACLGILAIQINRYWFLCDDAYISFRYARNLATGHGLVFNPGFERVEGFTNFLWVLLLAAGKFCGLEPESACHFLSILAGIAIILLVSCCCLKALPAGASYLWALWPALLLSVNRTFAMWCTSGLETKLFELFIIAGVFCAIQQTNEPSLTAPVFPWAIVWFVLAALTRPEGIVIAVCAMGTCHGLRFIRGELNTKTLTRDACVFTAVVGAHFVFRRAYYGDWLPNTYYAKVGGQTWWDMGCKYLAMFTLEYALWLWLPLIALVIWRGRIRAAVLIPVAVIVTLATYVAAIGGDHFEYRPLGLVLPLLCIAIFGDRAGLRPSGTLTSWLSMIVVGSCIVPEQIHHDFPAQYRPGFPGVTPRSNYRHDLIDPQQHAEIWAWNASRWYLETVNRLAADTSEHFVGLRQEEHRLFADATSREGHWLAAAVSNDSIPRDLYLAIGCIGAIGYYSDARILDLSGLTDRIVAHSPSLPERQMAHEKRADDADVKRRGVDLRAIDDIFIIFPDGHPKLMQYAQEARLGIRHPVFARLSPELYLAADPVQGAADFRSKAKSLHFLSAEDVLISQAAATAQDSHRDRHDELGVAYDMLLVSQGYQFLAAGARAEARADFERARAIDPRNVAAYNAIAH